MSQLDKKLEWIKAALAELPMEESEREVFIPVNCSPEELEQRCDATWEILEDLSLLRVSHKDGTPFTKQEKAEFNVEWFRAANNVCNGQTPLECVQNQGPWALALALRSPWG